MICCGIVLLRELGQTAADGHPRSTKDHNEEQATEDTQDELPERSRPSDVSGEELSDVRPHLVTVIGDVHNHNGNARLLGQHAETPAGDAQPELVACGTRGD